MKKINQFDAYDFCIQTERVVMDGDAYFKATAQEFPHLEIYEETPAAAYEVIVQSIKDLHAAAIADKRPFPTPNKTAEELECSGRITLRMPKPLHRRLLDQARRNGMPLNTEIVTQLSETSAMHELANQVIAKISTDRGRSVTSSKALVASYQSMGSGEFVDMHMIQDTLRMSKTGHLLMAMGSVADTKFLSDDPTFRNEVAPFNMPAQSYGT